MSESLLASRGTKSRTTNWNKKDTQQVIKLTGVLEPHTSVRAPTLLF